MVVETFCGIIMVIREGLFNRLSEVGPPAEYVTIQRCDFLGFG